MPVGSVRQPIRRAIYMYICVCWCWWWWDKYKFQVCNVWKLVIFHCGKTCWANQTKHNKNKQAKNTNICTYIHAPTRKGLKGVCVCVNDIKKLKSCFYKICMHVCMYMCTCATGIYSRSPTHMHICTYNT